jgi:hypothetical protein
MHRVERREAHTTHHLETKRQEEVSKMRARDGGKSTLSLETTRREEVSERRTRDGGKSHTS